MEYSNTLLNTKFSTTDTSKFFYDIKPKIQYGYYFLTINNSEALSAFRLEGSFSPRVVNSKFYPEFEIDLNGLFENLASFKSLGNYFIAFSPREKKSIYGYSQLTSLFSSPNQFIKSVKFLFEYMRANRRGTDKSDNLKIGILTETYLGLSSMYSSLSYTNNYYQKVSLFTFSLFFLLNGGTKIYYIREPIKIGK